MPLQEETRQEIKDRLKEIEITEGTTWLNDFNNILVFDFIAYALMTENEAEINNGTYHTELAELLRVVSPFQTENNPIDSGEANSTAQLIFQIIEDTFTKERAKNTQEQRQLETQSSKNSAILDQLLILIDLLKQQNDLSEKELELALATLDIFQNIITHRVNEGTNENKVENPQPEPSIQTIWLKMMEEHQSIAQTPISEAELKEAKQLGKLTIQDLTKRYNK